MSIAAASATVSVLGGTAPSASETESTVAPVETRGGVSRPAALVGGSARRSAPANRRTPPIAAIGALSASLVVVLVIFAIASEWGEEAASAPAVAVPPPMSGAERVASAAERRAPFGASDQVADRQPTSILDKSRKANTSESVDSIPAESTDGTSGSSNAADSPANSPMSGVASQTAAEANSATGSSTDSTAPPANIDSLAATKEKMPSAGTLTTGGTEKANEQAKPDGPSTTKGGTPGEYATGMVAKKSDAASGEPATKEEKALSAAEQKRQAYVTQVKKLVHRHFFAERRSPDLARGKPEDFFVVAKYEMPLSTRVADVRFEITDSLDNSVTQVVDYLMGSPTGTARDFQVVARYASMSEAADGLTKVRQQYDQAKEYQAQMLAYLQSQQRIQATSTRRC